MMIMKRFAYVVLALAAAAAFSCQKENDIIEEKNNNTDNTEALLDNGIPREITATITDEKTRTAYDAEGKFTWLSTDQVRLLVTEDLDTYSRQGIYTYRIKERTNDNKTAVFTSTGSAGDLTAFVDGDWKSTGIAVYPTSVLDRFNTPEAHSYGKPWFTLARGNVSGSISDIILMGVNSGAISNYKFSTAMAVLKVTLRNIPASAAAIKLCTSDKTGYPVDGDFSLTKNGDQVDLAFLTDWVASFNGYQKIDISEEGEIAERILYFNIPAASYPANTLSLRIEDSAGGKILERKIAAPLNIARNECLEVPALSYSYDIAFVANTLASGPSISWAIDCQRVRFCVSTNSGIDISEFNAGYTFQKADAGRYTGSYALSSFAAQRPSAT